MSEGPVMMLIAWRSVVRHKLRSAFLALCVVIGVAFVAGTFVLTDTIKNVYTKVFDQAYQGVAVSVRTRSELGTMTARAPVPSSLLLTIRSVPGVRLAEGSVFAIGGRIFDANNKPVGNQFAPTFLGSWPTKAELTSFSIVRGAAPVNGNDVVVDLEAATRAKFRIGDEVHIQTTQGLKQFRLVGVAKYGSSNNMGGASAVLFTLATAQQQTGRVGKFDNIEIASVKGIAPGTMQDRVQAVVGAKYEAVTGTELSAESSDAINTNLSFFSTFMLVFAGVSLFVGAFIVYNTFAIVVAQRTREMALLRALGADGEQVIGSIIAESILIGLIASVFGLVGGVGLAIALKQLLAAVGFDLPGGHVVILPRTVIVSVLGGMLVTVISAVGPAIRAARVPPLAAVRTVALTGSAQKRARVAIGATVSALGIAATVYGARSMKVKWLGVGAFFTVLGVSLLAPSIVPPFVHVLAAPIRRFRGVSGQLAEENASRSAQRTATTAAALMIGTALIAASLVLASSINTSTNKILSQGLRAELIVSANGITGIGSAATAALRSTPGVSAVAPYRYGAFKIGNATKQLSAMDGATLDPKDPTSSLDLNVSSGSIRSLDQGGVAVSERIARDHKWKVGDSVAMIFATGPHPLKIQAIYKTTAFGDYMVSLRTHELLYAQSADQLAFVRVGASSNVAAVKNRITAVLQTVAPSAKVQDQDQYAGQIRAQVSQILNLITALVLLAILIALLGVLITMLLSVFERTHELGLLRAVGMDRRDVRSMVRWEAAIISTFGAVLGVVLGIGLGYALTRTLRAQGITTIEFPIRSLVSMIVLVTLAGVGASLYPARRAGKLNVLKAIASD